MVEKLTREKIESLIRLEDEEFNIESFRRKYGISPESSLLYVTFTRLIAEKKLKRIGRGLYKKLDVVKVIKSLNTSETKPIDLIFPYGYDDTSSFGFEDMLEVDEGNCIVIAGVSNSAKTAWVINMVALNMERYPCVLMGNEYTRVDGQLNPAFVRRVRRMEWVQWEKDDGELKFIILPVKEDYEYWVEPGKINFIDWVNLTDNFYQVGKIIEDIKVAVGNGIAVIVLQKAEGSLLGRGAGFSRDLADFYISIDPLGTVQRRLTVVKAKVTKGLLEGRMWGFKIINGGTQFHNIREIKRCKKCYGRGHYSAGGECRECQGLGYIDL